MFGHSGRQSLRFLHASLGREYALAFAERGAYVVVNDLGGSMSGEGKGSRAADTVVNEIFKRGGKAVANYDSVEDGEKLIQTALDNFGRIDVVVNNAGILRDKSFARTSDIDWDLIHRVHLRGSFMVTRAAWPHMKKQNYGRIIMTSSAAGIYGNFGQANYSAAKLGLLGLSNTLSVEGKKNNIFCNTIAPIAGSRLTETVMPPDLISALKPEYVAPLVLYLCSEECQESGSLFELGAGWIGKLRWQRTEGAIVRKKNEKMTAEQVRDNWKQITDFDHSSYPASNQESITHVIKVTEKFSDDNNSDTSNSSSPPSPSDGNSNGMNPELAKSFRPKPGYFTYTAKDAILYALGVGANTKEDDYLKFLYEGAEDFSVLPSFCVIPVMSTLIESLSKGIPGVDSPLVNVLHGEQYCEVLKPFPPAATLRSEYRVLEILDKGSSAIVLYNVDVFNESNEKLAFCQNSIFVIGKGRFGGARTCEGAISSVPPPKRAPDASIKETTSVDQAALYRLSGDSNPLHIDPSFAAMAGFKQPILHGLCSFGFAIRHVLKQYANNDVSVFKSTKVRFAKPVLPGQTLQTDMWKEGNRIHFQTKVVESGEICISGAYVDLKESNRTAQVTSSSSTNLKSDAIFEQLAKELPNRKGLAAKINAIFVFDVSSNGQSASKWCVDMKNSQSGDVYKGTPKVGKPDCTLHADDDILVSIITGKLAAPQAFMSGKLKVKGNIMLAQKLGQIFQEQAKL